MDGIANVAKQQVHANVNLQEKSDNVQQSKPLADVVHDKFQQEQKKEQFNESDVKGLVDNLNKEIAVLNTSLQFGVDKQDTFYVSVVDKKTDKMIRRWPVEQAETILPKMKELTGLLFDTKG